MVRKILGFLLRQEGGIATYVAQAVMILAVLSVGAMIIGATTSVGTFISDQLRSFLMANRP
jgi:hypothetical protein